MSIYTIYRATNTINGKVYIGFDSDWPKRQISHKCVAFNCDYKEYNLYFHKAIRKYGWDNFIWEPIYQSPEYEYTLKTMEPYFIGEYGSRKNGYNLTDGGDGCIGYKHSKETIEKMSGENHVNYSRTIYKLEHPQHGIFEGTRHAFMKLYGEGKQISNFDNLVKRKTCSVKGWMLLAIDDIEQVSREKRVNPNVDATIYKLSHSIYGEFSGTKIEIRKRLGRNAYDLFREKIKSYKGWQLVEKPKKIPVIKKQPILQQVVKKANIKEPVKKNSIDDYYLTDNTIYGFEHDTYGQFEGTIENFTKKFYYIKITNASLRNIFRNRQGMGWKLYSKDGELNKNSFQKIYSKTGRRNYNRKIIKPEPKIYNFKNINNGLEFSGSQCQFMKTFDLQERSSSISRLIRGRCFTLEGWKLVNEDGEITQRINPKKDKIIHNFIHPIHGEFIGDRHSLVNTYPELNIGNICQIILGEKKSHRGWKIV